MKTHANLTLTLGFMIACALFGSLVALLIVIYPPTGTQDYVFRKPLVGTVFLLVCAAGSLAAVVPRRCSMAHAARIPKGPVDSDGRTGFSVSTEGHHPNCGRFSAHTVRFNGTLHCAACMGLFSGGVAAMVIATVYFFFGLSAGPVGLPALVLGELGLGLGLVQFKFRGCTRCVVNVLFVLGGSLMLIAVDQLVGVLFVDVFVTSLIVLWILVRVMLSQWDHHRICVNCGFSCEKERKKDVLPSSATQTVEGTDDD
jgi:hypothetical protein